MRTLNSTELLYVWEQGRTVSFTERALFLLEMADPESPHSDLARLSIGERDNRLLRLRESVFGSRLACVVHCPACQEQLEFQIDTTALTSDLSEVKHDASRTVSASGLEITFRLPTSEDLASVSGFEDLEEAKSSLLQRCIEDVQPAGGPNAPIECPTTNPASLPSAARTALVKAMREADPMAEIRTSLTCVGCGHGWESVLDIVQVFWQEIDMWARRTLQEIHSLASAYGWPERDILALSPQRRRLYMEMMEA